MANAALSANEVSLVLVKSPLRRSKDGAEGRHACSTAASRGAAALGVEIGRASWRVRVLMYVWILLVTVSLNKNTTHDCRNHMRLTNIHVNNHKSTKQRIIN